MLPGCVARGAHLLEKREVAIYSGNTGMTRVLMGSVAEGVVRRSPIPVLTLKADFEDTPQNSGNEAKKETNKEAEGDTGKPAGATT